MNNGTTSESPQKRIVILGGGFGGVYAALHLERLLARARGGDLPGMACE